MSSLPAHIHQYLRIAVRTLRGATMKPDDVPTQIAKTYSRMRHIPLDEPRCTITLKEALTRRASGRSSTGTCPSHYELSELFGLAVGNAENAYGHRHYPSGGSLYPVEVYLVTKLPDDTHAAVYHYQPHGHALERLWQLPPEVEVVDLFRNTQEAAVPAGIFLTARWHRTVSKYGDFGYLLALLEAGHIAQNLTLAAAATNLNLCPMGGFNDELISEILDLNTDDEQPLYALTLASLVKNNA